MTLAAEAASRGEDLRTRRRRDPAGCHQAQGAVDLVAPGSLPNDGKVIADERKVD